MPNEQLLFTDDINKATKEIEQFDGRVTHQLTELGFVAQLPDTVDIKALKYSQAQPSTKLDTKSQLAVKAWEARAKERTIRKPIKGDGFDWDEPGFEPPGSLLDEDMSIKK